MLLPAGRPRENQWWITSTVQRLCCWNKNEKRHCCHHLYCLACSLLSLHCFCVCDCVCAALINRTCVCVFMWAPGTWVCISFPSETQRDGSFRYFPVEVIIHRQRRYGGTVEQLQTSQTAVITFPFAFSSLTLCQRLITYLGKKKSNWQSKLLNTLKTLLILTR